MNTKFLGLVPLTLAALLLSACGQAEGAATPTPTPEAPLDSPLGDAQGDHFTTCRIVDGGDTGELLLAAVEGGEIYTLSAQDLPVLLDGGSAGYEALRNGMVVTVRHTGGTLEAYPAQFDGPTLLTGDSATVDDRCGLYLQALEDLWRAGDNGEGLKYLGLDLSRLGHLTDGEKHALAWRFAQRHGLTPLEGTARELLDQGYLSELHGEDHPTTAWLDGILFTLATDEEAAWSLPGQRPGDPLPVLTAFEASKWRGSDTAHYFTGCVGRQQEDGSWTYSVQAEAETVS